MSSNFGQLCFFPHLLDLYTRLLHPRVFGSKDNHAYHWLTGEGVRLSLQEFFELFLPSASVDLGTFVQLCPRQKSRPYTIASSSRTDKKTIGLCVSMVQEELVSLAALVEGTHLQHAVVRHLI